jgi:hypothetical protein
MSARKLAGRGLYRCTQPLGQFDGSLTVEIAVGRVLGNLVALKEGDRAKLFASRSNRSAISGAKVLSQS